MKPGVITLSDNESTKTVEAKPTKRAKNQQKVKTSNTQRKTSNASQVSKLLTTRSTYLDVLRKAKAKPKTLLEKQKNQHYLTSIEWVVLGFLHKEGVGTDKNLQEAFACYKRATQVDENCVRAWNNLGLCYEHGVGTDNNPEEAFACYKKSTQVDENFTLAWNNLGYCYQQGIGTDKNPEQALVCFEKIKQANPRKEFAPVDLTKIVEKLPTTLVVKPSVISKNVSSNTNNPSRDAHTLPMPEYSPPLTFSISTQPSPTSSLHTASSYEYLKPCAYTSTPFSTLLNTNEPSRHAHTPSSPLTFSRSTQPSLRSSIHATSQYEHLKQENALLEEENRILRAQIALLEKTQVRPTNTFRS